MSDTGNMVISQGHGMGLFTGVLDLCLLHSAHM